MTFLDQVVAYFEPRRPIAAEERERARFAIRAWLLGQPFLVVFLAVYALNHMHWLVLIQVLTIVGGSGVLFALRLGASVGAVLNASLAVQSASFVFGAASQLPFDVSSVFFLAIVPMVAMYVGGQRVAAVWAAIVTVAAVASLWLDRAGVHLPSPDRDPNITLTWSLNFCFQTFLGFLFTRAYAAERSRAVERVRALDRAKTTFLANVSHEIRTPMNAVVGMTEVLLQGRLDADQRHQLEVVHRAGQSLVLLINDLLDMAKLEEGRLELTVHQFDLRILLADLDALYSPMARARGLEFCLRVEDQVPSFVTGDALRLRQVLANLLSNAIKFTEQGTITLTAWTERDDLVGFAVTDTGVGIPESLRPRLFARFEQGDGSPTRRSGGAGLGLAISRDMAQRMGGSLVHVAAHGPGARFELRLPLPRADESSAASAATGPGRSPNRSAPVLIVDDNVINLAVARGLLVNLGQAVGTASNGREALAAVQSGTWSLVLMDLQMPQMDGLEATRQIRALPAPLGALPIVGVTASALPADLTACLDAGMNDVLVKPLTLKGLDGALGRYQVVGVGDGKGPEPVRG